MTLLLAQAYSVQRTYGKAVVDLAMAAETFAAVLHAYSPDEVCRAFCWLLENSPDVPTPSDVIRVVRGDVALDAAYYAELLRRRRAGDYLKDDEENYLRSYERQRRES